MADRPTDMATNEATDRTSESVWEYPRPPRLERTSRRLRVVHAGRTVAETERGWRVLETSHPPVYYFPRADVQWELLAPSAARGSLCEWKGAARYVDLVVPGTAPVVGVGWIYPHPTSAFSEIAGALAIYASRVEACFVDGERVQAQPGDFYGGWITRDIRGPFKGVPGTMGW